MGPGGEGPMGGMAGMEPHHMNGSLGTVLHRQIYSYIDFSVVFLTSTILKYI